MRTTLVTVALLALFYCATAFQITLDSSGLSNGLNALKESVREKRQVETFDDEYPTAMSENEQEEPGFWDRVVRVAIKLFSKFVEWLNSS